jgi:TatA/E family protein of Tat protein translocase
MFGLGSFGLAELAIIAAILVLLFGARHLPAMGSELGQALRKLKEDFLPRRTEDIELPDDLHPPAQAQEGVNRED